MKLLEQAVIQEEKQQVICRCIVVDTFNHLSINAATKPR